MDSFVVILIGAGCFAAGMCGMWGLEYFHWERMVEDLKRFGGSDEAL